VDLVESAPPLLLFLFFGAPRLKARSPVRENESLGNFPERSTGFPGAPLSTAEVSGRPPRKTMPEYNRPFCPSFSAARGSELHQCLSPLLHRQVLGDRRRHVPSPAGPATANARSSFTECAVASAKKQNPSHLRARPIRPPVPRRTSFRPQPPSARAVRASQNARADREPWVGNVGPSHGLSRLRVTEARPASS